MRTSKTVFQSVAKSCLIVATAIVLAGSLFAAPQGQRNQSKAKTLIKVEAKYVCMINNKRFSKEQIAIEVENRTYYGCCEMCKEKLRSDPESRAAIDPVSGNKVDKAQAVIGASDDDDVFYFESLENLKRFTPGSKPSSRK